MGEGFRRRHREVNAVQALIHTTQHEFPVVDGAGRLRGVLTHDAMIRSLMEHGPGRCGHRSHDAGHPDYAAPPG
jgi:CBS domain-containing protein